MKGGVVDNLPYMKKIAQIKSMIGQKKSPASKLAGLFLIKNPMKSYFIIDFLNMLSNLLLVSCAY